MFTTEQMKKRGFFKESDYKKLVDFMLKNNEENDLKHIWRIYWKYFSNIGIEDRTDLDRQVFYCLYNNKPCYYDFILQEIEIRLGEDLKIKVKVNLEDLIEFFKNNSSLFEFQQINDMRHDWDKIKYNTVLSINY